MSAVDKPRVPLHNGALFNNKALTYFPCTGLRVCPYVDGPNALRGSPATIRVAAGLSLTYRGVRIAERAKLSRLIHDRRHR